MIDEVSDIADQDDDPYNCMKGFDDEDEDLAGGDEDLPMDDAPEVRRRSSIKPVSILCFPLLRDGMYLSE